MNKQTETMSGYTREAQVPRTTVVRYRRHYYETLTPTESPNEWRYRAHAQCEDPSPPRLMSRDQVQALTNEPGWHSLLSTEPPCWFIDVREVWIQTYKIPLDKCPSLEQAVQLVADNQVEPNGELEYSHTMDIDTWSAYGPDGELFDQLNVCPIPGIS